MFSGKIPALIVLVSLVPFYAKACNVKPYAESYIESIQKVLGGEKPKLVVEKNKDKDTAAFYEEKTIHIYKGDYKSDCADKLPYLKSIIAHEYSHHIAAKLRPLTNLRGEKLAYLAEHSIGDVVFGDDIEYDNDEDLEHPTAYANITKMLLSKQAESKPQKNSR